MHVSPIVFFIVSLLHMFCCHFRSVQVKQNKVNVKLTVFRTKMELIKQYVGGSSSDDEDFCGYGDDTVEKYPDSQNSFLQQVPEHRLPSDHEDEDGSELTDSSGSFFAGSPKRLKQTKKEKARQKLAKKRKLAHPVKQVVCGCRRNCSGLVSKDDRLVINEMFWSLSYTEQNQYIRERVQQIAVQNRSRESFNQQPRKQHSYKFTIQIGSDNSVDVCRKFFLNTLGYGEHCG